MPNQFFHKIPFLDSSHSARTRKGDYEIGTQESDIIGQGGFGRVVKAKSKKTNGTVVAMKIVKKEAIGSYTAYRKLVTSGVARCKENPDVCFPTDWFESRWEFYLVFPLLTGGDLIERINKGGRYKEAAAKKIMRRILNSLVFLHTNGMIHRDIKPDNFVYRTVQAAVDDVVLIDFGLCKTFDTVKESDHLGDQDPKDQVEVVGTPGYAAPEVFLRTGYGKNSDVFGAGVVAYNLVSGLHPWSSSNFRGLIQETVQAHVEFPKSVFPDLSEEGKEFIKSLLSADPHARPSAKEALEHTWFSEYPELNINGGQHTPGDLHYSIPQMITTERPLLTRTNTIKPEHPVARTLTANGIDALIEDQ